MSLMTKRITPRPSAAKLAANRKNAKNSTGPKTPEGKAKVALNALKHGFRADQKIHPDEAPAITKRIKEYVAEHKPRTPTQRNLVTQAAIASVRLERVADREARTHQLMHATALD